MPNTKLQISQGIRVFHVFLSLLTRRGARVLFNWLFRRARWRQRRHRRHRLFIIHRRRDAAYSKEHASLGHGLIFACRYHFHFSPMYCRTPQMSTSLGFSADDAAYAAFSTMIACRLSWLRGDSPPPPFSLSVIAGIRYFSRAD